MTGIALIALSAALVVVTAAYTIEVRRTRLLTVRPRLALGVDMLSATAGVIALKNLGPGTAVDVEVTLTFEGIGDERRWIAHTFVPGASHQFVPPRSDGSTGQPLHISQLADQGVIVSVTGKMKDVYDRRHRVSDRIDVGEWWTLVTRTSERFRVAPMTSITRELGRINENLRKLVKATESSKRVAPEPPPAAHPDTVPPSSPSARRRPEGRGRV